MSSNTESTGYGETIRTIALVVIIVASVPIAFMGAAFVDGGSSGIAAAQNDSNTTYYEDFSDGDADGWDSQYDFSVVNDGFYGDHSIKMEDTDAVANEGWHGMNWSAGPEFDTQDSFEISGTYRSNGTQYRTFIGLVDEETTSAEIDNEGAFILHSYEHDKIYLATHHDDEPIEGEGVDGAPSGSWMEYRLQMDGGTARMKVWGAGTDEPENWQMEREYGDFQGFFSASSGSTDADRDMTVGRVDAGGHSISGQVLNQNGNPVSNATVETYAVDYDALNESVEDVNQTAQELMDEAAGVDLGFDDVGFQEDFDWGSLTSSDLEYVLAHNGENFGAPSGLHNRFTERSIGTPSVVLDPDQTQVFSVWEPGTGGDNALDNSYPGGIKSAGSVTIEQLSPTGGVTDTWVRNATSTYTIPRGWPYDDVTRDVVHADLPEGNFYRIHPTSNQAASTVVFVGDIDPQSVINETADQIQGQLETEAGQLTERAESIRNNIESGPFRRVTTTTDENGNYELRVPTGVQRGAVQAYRANGDFLQDITGPSLQDLRSASQVGYNGTYFLAAPEFSDVPRDNLTIQGYETPSLPWQDMESYSDLQSWLENEYETWLADAGQNTPWAIDPNATSTEEFRNRLEDLTDVVGASDTIEEAYLNLTDRDSLPNADELSREELQNEIQNLESAMDIVDNGMIPGAGEDPVFGDDGLMSAEFPYPNDLNGSATEVMLRWTDGEMTAVNDEYVSIEDGGLFGGDTVVVEDLPIEELADGRTFGQIQVNAVSEDGDLGTVESGVQLPGFEGLAEPPEAIRFSDIRPDGDEHVTAELIAGDSSSIDSVTDAMVRGPQGSELNATILDDNRVRFKTGGVGTHMIRFVYQNGQGSELASITSLEASEESYNEPPTIRVEKPTFGDGRVAVIGGGLQSADAEYDSDEGSLSVTAVQNGDDGTIGELNLRALEETSHDASTLDVQILDSDETTIDSHVIVNVHTSMSAEALLRHASGPITHGGDTNYGSVETRELSNGETVRIIQTRTDSNGAIDGLEINNDPGLLDRFLHGISVQLGIDISNPLDSLPSIPLDSNVAFGGLIGIGTSVRLRRRWAA